MKVVILGYNGLIGNSVLEYLIKNNSLYIICVGRNIEKKPYRNQRIKYYKWDYTSFKSSNLFFLKKANIIINCVGKTDNNQNNLKNINIIFIKKLLSHINNLKHKVRFVHLSSVAVYGGIKTYFGQSKHITETSAIKAFDLYSKSKFKGDTLIQNVHKKNFSYTIFRITNVFGGKKKSNLYKFLRFSLMFGFWLKCYNDIMFNFVNVKDVSQAVALSIFKLKASKNKIYIISDDFKQYQLYRKYEKIHKKRIRKIQLHAGAIKFLIHSLPLPKKLVNFFSIFSSRVSYNNQKIKEELNFKPQNSLIKKIKLKND